MSNKEDLERATKCVNEAIAFDNNEKYDEAYKRYCEALDEFLKLIKKEKNETLKKLLTAKTDEYMTRAEKLQKHLADAKRKKAGMVGANGSSTGKGKEDGEDGGLVVDEDSKKLRSALAGAILVDRPNVKWEDVAGLEQAKEALKEAVLLPIKFPQMFQGNRKPWKGILLYGPPGTGKSYLAKALATEAKSTFFSLSSSDLVSKWMGESERYVLCQNSTLYSPPYGHSTVTNTCHPHPDSSNNSSTWHAKTTPPSSSSTKSTPSAAPAAKASPKPRDASRPRCWCRWTAWARTRRACWSSAPPTSLGSSTPPSAGGSSAACTSPCRTSRRGRPCSRSLSATPRRA